MTKSAKHDNTNAVSHGMWTDRPVIPGMEDEAQYERHLAGITENLAPEGALEEELAARIASLLWRLRRVTRYEVAETARLTAIVRRDHDDVNTYAATHPEENLPPIHHDETLRKQETRLVLDDFYLDRIMRYEAHLHRQFLQTLHELEALQARRNGEQTHLARLDISASPATYLAAARSNEGRF
ncbi:MAG: hypothetical protein IIC91_02990 [Chloroflexi bacterium]|nr:hypothetical protein [Chloroflexota bacterium]